MKKEKYFSGLELDKIIHILQGSTFTQANENLTYDSLMQNSAEDTRYQLELTDAMYSLYQRFSLPGMPKIADVQNPIYRAQKGGILSLKELLNIGRLMGACKSLLDWYRGCEDHPDVLNGYMDSLTYHDYIHRKISSSVLSEEELADTASEELYIIRKSIARAQAKAREKLDEMLHSTTKQKYLQDQVITMRDGRFVVPVKAEHKGDVPGLVHDSSGSGATLFVEPMAVVELNNRVRILQVQEKEEIERIMQELTRFVVEASEDILTDYEMVCRLDLVMAKAQFARRYKCTKPEINENRYIELKKARHPLIDAEKVVPIDVVLGGDYTTLVITGPNTGGKTVCLKTLGLFALMARCGLLLPVASGSKMAYLENVFVDIGDEQSIEQSLSTFSSHMVNIVEITKVADRHSLILLDELGAGTDPNEGAALAISILDYLKENGCLIAASTHYSELKIYAMNTPGVQNASCEFDVETLQPTYRLIIGVPGRSNAFAIVKKLGLTHMIVDRAKELTASDKMQFEDVLESLDETRTELEKTLQKQEQILEKIRRREEESKVLIERELEAARREAKQAKLAAQNVIDKVQRQAEQIVEEIKTRNKNADKSLTPGAVRNKVDKLYDAVKLKDVDDDRYQLPRELKVGDQVTFKGMNSVCTVAEIKGKDVTLQVGNITTKAKISDLKLVSNRQAKKEGGYRHKTDTAHKSLKMEIDLRGQNVEEASLELDRFIDDAVLAGLSEVTIIHGKGTGALRAGIHTYLKRHKNVAKFRLGTFGEGEMGVTVVTLK